MNKNKARNIFLFLICSGFVFFTGCPQPQDPNALKDNEMPVLSTDVDLIKEGCVKFTESSEILEYKIGNDDWKIINTDEINAKLGDQISVRRRAFGLPDASDYKAPSNSRTILVQEKNLGKKKSSGLDLNLTDKNVSIKHEIDSTDKTKIIFTAVPSTGLTETFGTNLNYKWQIEPLGILIENAKDENNNEIQSKIICNTQAASKNFPYYISVFVSMNKNGLNLNGYDETWSEQIEMKITQDNKGETVYEIE